ncbi:MAG: SDR family oxidoreductase [Chromatiales bacterium]|jgi:3-oxoacyl-[acyl-carrier protein] reductase|nr:SDR family oxidoreductase [Chromatiales bacterium]
MDRNRELEGKVAIVTGSARNIGRSIAEELARAGAAVTINAVQALDLCEEVAAGIRADGGKAVAVLSDIRSQDDVARLVDATVKEFGGIDILINNAAVRNNINFSDLAFDDWVELREVALDGAFRVSMACAPHMIKRGSGAIVGIHGMNSYTGSGAHRSAVKDGMAGMARGMASDLGPHNITSNVAVVGPFDTEREGSSGALSVPKRYPNIPLGRKGVSQDMADLVRFLVGPYARFITGQTIHLNGGAHMPH